MRNTTYEREHSRRIDFLSQRPLRANAIQQYSESIHQRGEQRRSLFECRLVPRRHLLEQGVFGEQREGRLEHPLQVRGACAVQKVGEVVEPLPHEGFLELFHRREVPIDGPHAHISGSGNGIQSQGLVAGNEVARGSEDAAPVSRGITAKGIHTSTLTGPSIRTDYLSGYADGTHPKGTPMTVSSRPIAVVTGASSGIGEQYARRYAREGFDLVLVARSENVLQSLANELAAAHGVHVEVHAADLADAVAVTVLVDKLTKELPRLDHLVNCAGVAPNGDLANADEAALRQMIDLNITALTLLTRAAIIRMRAAGTGTIVNVASAAGYQPMPHMAAYAASKSYVLMFTEAMYEENRRHGLRILAVSPGDTATPMSANPEKARKPEQVVDTTWRAMSKNAPAVVDGAANSILTTLVARVLPKRLGLRIAERMFRDMA